MSRRIRKKGDLLILSRMPPIDRGDGVFTQPKIAFPCDELRTEPCPMSNYGVLAT
jgi:hypothetical protein